MKRLIFVITLSLVNYLTIAQSTAWTESDRKYLVEKLTSSLDLLTKETQNLTEKQLKFKESPDRWSINQVVEHIALWEILLEHEISRGLEAGMKPERKSEADSTTLNFIMETKPHYSLEYTKPYSYTIPLGLNETKNNSIWISKMRNESIDYIKTTKDNLRLYYGSYGNLHQIYILIFGHADRHLRQIKKIKSHPNYPK
jgi:outer membrane receptor for monomeric catechols